ncbi:hypothetical protein Pelo_17444 [Pelomyxa schiedti]|nr:hypothetical protein Pelo_17444 [Pelomyxa schiedti]
MRRPTLWLGCGLVVVVLVLSTLPACVLAGSLPPKVEPPSTPSVAPVEHVSSMPAPRLLWGATVLNIGPRRVHHGTRAAVPADFDPAAPEDYGMGAGAMTSMCGGDSCNCGGDVQLQENGGASAFARSARCEDVMCEVTFTFPVREEGRPDIVKSRLIECGNQATFEEVTITEERARYTYQITKISIKDQKSSRELTTKIAPFEIDGPKKQVVFEVRHQEQSTGVSLVQTTH